jgi:subtilisin family serine protease
MDLERAINLSEPKKPMKRTWILGAALVSLFLFEGTASAQQQRYIVTATRGAASVQSLCSSLGCTVEGALDGTVGQTYLVTSSKNLLGNLVGGLLNLLEQLLGIKSVEADQVLPLPQVPLANIASGLSDTTPVNYYGSVAWHGYTAQPAMQIIRLGEAQNTFQDGGSGIVADIDTGVDPNHPVLQPVLLQGYDFTRNQPGASEWLDVSSMPNGPASSSAQDEQPAVVQQSTAAVLDQSTAAVLDGNEYAAFGHGTMTAGLIHLVAPQAKILPLKAFSANGSAYLSNILAALYFAVQHNANVVNMSFELTSSSTALSQAVSYANKAGVVLVASAGNDNTSAAVYPAAFDGQVVGIASTSDGDTKSSFSNYGTSDVWIAAPGEGIVSTYPGATYATSSGTSFSSPMVAGAAALFLNFKHSVNQTQAANALAKAKLLTPNLNHGRLDVFAALSDMQLVGGIL